MKPKLVPELDVSSLIESLSFYCDTIGFRIKYDRPEDRFAYLELDGVDLMLEELSGSTRRFSTSTIERPFGRGINFQIEVENVDAVYRKTCAAGYEVLIPLEDMWYRRGVEEVGQRQFVVADPDGYLLRFAMTLGTRKSQG